MKPPAAPLPSAVILVGRGRMTGAFSAALSDAGLPFSVVPSRALPASRNGALDGSHASILWLLCVRDGALRDTATALASASLLAPGDRVFHLAGMRSPDELEAAREAGCFVGAMHPLVAVAEPARPPPLRGAVLSFEGDDEAHRGALWLSHKLGSHLVRLEHAERASYHAAAALVASGGVALAVGAVQLFLRATPSLAAPRAASMVASLLRSVAHNIELAGPERALASPLLRGDTDTVAQHLERMGPLPATRALYAAVLAVLLDTLAATSALAPHVLERARALLQERP